jgi:TolB-like protein
MSLIAELKRRNVFRVGLAYALIAWVLLQAADFGLDLVGAPNWVIQSLSVLALIGLPAALAFSWVYEMTPQGIKRESEIDRLESITPNTGRKLDRIIILALVLAVAFLLGERFMVHPEDSQGPATEPAVATSVDVQKKSIAVLPFLALSSGPDDEYFADGLTEEILNSLAQLPELLVTARTSAFHFKGQNLPTSEIAASLGVAHIVEGSVRRSGDRLRVTAQLIRADDGFHLWSENYDETTDDVIAVQEDIAEKIAGALDVILDEASRENMRQAGIRDVEAFINYQKARDLYSSAHGSEDLIANLRLVNAHLDIALERAPEFGLAYLFHSDLYTHILLENASGARRESEDELANAMESALSDFRAAARYANTQEQRANVDLDIAILSGDWRDMDKRVERLLNEDSCSSPIWIAALNAWFSEDGRMMRRLQNFRSCDPLGSTGLVNLAGSAVWTGDPAQALQTVEEALALHDHDWLGNWYGRALIMNDQLDQAETAVNLHTRSAFEKDLQMVLVSAARGDTPVARALADQWQQDHGPSDFEGLVMSAWIGDRDAANRFANAMDARPMGYLNLMIATLWCACGAPFELEATPDFAVRLQGSGMAWPPTSIIKLPLKDW